MLGAKPELNSSFEVITWTTCRWCGLGGLTRLSNLGKISLACFPDQLSDGHTKKYRLKLVKCESCGLVQLKDSVDRNLLYRQYWYESGINRSMVESLQEIAIITNSLSPKTVLDIGCNDGTLLSMVDDNVQKIGVDPSSITPRNGFRFINDFFPSKKTEALKSGSIDVITSIAVMYDIDNIKEFLLEVKRLLSCKGFLVLQLMDLKSMIEQNAFDNICHEHVTYPTVGFMAKALSDLGLTLFDVTTNPTNGGSVRLFASTKESSIKYGSVGEHIAEEQHIDTSAFSENTRRIKKKLSTWIIDNSRHGKVIDVLGASTKGNTLLGYLGLDKRYIRYALEVNPRKFGRYFGSTGIEIKPEHDVLDKHGEPDAIVVLPWHFKDMFKNRLSSFVERGGEVIWPLPRPAIWKKGVTKSGEKFL